MQSFAVPSNRAQTRKAASPSRKKTNRADSSTHHGRSAMAAVRFASATGQSREIGMRSGGRISDGKSLSRLHGERAVVTPGAAAQLKPGGVR